MARRRRWIVRILLGLLGLVLLCVGAALVLLAHLEWGPVKRFVQAQARDQGVEIDYDEASATLGGVHMRGLRVLSPPADAVLAPSLVTIARIDGRWSPFAKRLDELVVRDVEVTLVVDEDGTTSLDRLLAAMPRRERPPPEPLSHLASLVPRAISANARVEGVSLTLLPRGGGEKTRLEGVAAAAQLAGGRLAVQLGPTEIRLAMGARQAVARLGGTFELEPTGRLRAALDVSLGKQDIAPTLPPIAKVIDLAATVDFLPGERRTHVRIERLGLLDAAARVDADADLHDAESGSVRPVVHTASCAIDLVALARAVPPELGPLAIDAEPLRCSANELTLSPPRGTLSLRGQIARLAWKDTEARGLAVDIDARTDGDVFRAEAHVVADSLVQPGTSVSRLDAKIEATTPPSGWPVGVRGAVAVGDVTLSARRARSVRVELTGTLHGPRSLDLAAGIDADRLEGPVLAQGAHVDLELTRFMLADVALESTGTVTARGRIARAEQSGGPRAADVSFASQIALGGRAPSRATLTADAARLFVPSLGAGFAGRPAHLSVTAPRLEIDAAAPAKTRGEAKVSASYGTASIEGTLARGGGVARWDLAGRAETLGPARAVRVASRGELSKDVAQDTTIEAGRVENAAATFQGVRVQVGSTGSGRHHQGKIVASFDGAAVRGRQVGGARIDAVADVNLDRPSLDLQLTGARPQANLHLFAEIDAGRTVRWQARGRMARLGSLAALLPPSLDWQRASIDVRGQGAASGVVRRVENGVPILVASPMATARGKQSLEIGLRDIRYRGAEETRADVDALTLKAEVELGDTRHATMDLDVPSVTAVASGVTVVATGFTAHLDAAQAPDGEVDAQITVQTKSAKQSAFAAYPVRDAELTLSITGDPRVTLAMSAHFANPGAGTALDVAGELERTAEPSEDAVFGRHSLTLDGSIDQKLDALDGTPDLLRARGRLSIPFRVESGDLSLFRTSARVRMQDVQLELPGRKIRVVDLRGELPVVQEILLSPAGAERVGSGERGLYPQLRFGDHLPYLGTADYVSVGEIRVGERSFGPVAGNVRLDRDVFSVDQLEMNALGGKISGQCLVELAGKDTRIAFRGKVTGVRPSSGDERLDANAAVTLVPYRQGLEGRVEIVRIGRDHLRDLLDLWDPYHAEVSANRVRLGLKLGYPKQVRLHFLRGFATLFVELGGLAGVVRIDEIRGIPVGPALARWLAPILEKDR